jgi:hypothetical protein
MFEHDPLLSFIYRRAERESPLSSKQAGFSDNEMYLEIPQVGEVCQEWRSLYRAESMLLDLSTAHQLAVTLGLKYPDFVDIEDDLNIAKVVLYFKDPEKDFAMDTLELGILKGRLFIEGQQGDVLFTKKRLTEGILLRLLVKPLTNGKLTLKLIALTDQGEKLATLHGEKPLKYNAKINVSTGAHFNYLKIKGFLY